MVVVVEHLNAECALEEKCLSECLVSDAIVSKPTIDEAQHWYGSCEKDLKERCNDYTATKVRNKSKENLQHLKEKNIMFTINQKVTLQT